MDALRLLVEASESEGFEFVSRFVQRLSADYGILEDPRFYYLGGFDDGALVAVGGVTPDPYVDEESVGRVRHVYVSVESRRKGIGRRLLDALETDGCRRFKVLRLRSATPDASAFYESLGYEPLDDPNATHWRQCRSPNGAV